MTSLNERKAILGSWQIPIRTFITARVMASVAAVLGLSSFPSIPTLGQQGVQKVAHGKWMELLVGAWERADGMWYMGIAKNGYTDPASHAFMPLYPFLIRILNPIIPGPMVLTALLISNACFALALYFVYQLARDELKDEEASARSIAYLAFFPGSLFFFAPYTESLFLCLASGALWMARQKKWAFAALFALLLGITRNLGVIIMIPLFLEIARQRAWKQTGWLLLAPIGLLGWIGWCEHTTGDALAFVHQQSQWQRASLAPWLTLLRGIRQAWDYSLSYPGGGYVFEAAAVVIAIIMGIIGIVLRRISLPLSAFLWLALIPALTAPFEGRMLMSCTRFVAVVFPVFLVMGSEIKSKVFNQAVQASFMAAYGIAVAMYVANQYMY
jgi:hypothetical protein